MSNVLPTVLLSEVFARSPLLAGVRHGVADFFGSGIPRHDVHGTAIFTYVDPCNHPAYMAYMAVPSVWDRYGR